MMIARRPASIGASGRGRQGRGWAGGGRRGVGRARLVWRMASSKLPTTPDMATIKRLPKEWPARPEPSEKRYWKRSVIRGSAAARAAVQVREAPGGGVAGRGGGGARARGGGRRACRRRRRR